MPSSNLDRSIILTTIVVQRTDVRPKQTFTLEIDIFIIELTTKLKNFVLGLSKGQCAEYKCWEFGSPNSTHVSKSPQSI